RDADRGEVGEGEQPEDRSDSRGDTRRVRDRASEEHGHEHEGERGQRFDDRISDGNGRPAVAAATGEKQPRDHRQVVPAPDGVSATRASGGGPHDGETSRNPIGHDVEERADREPDRAGEQGDYGNHGADCFPLASYAAGTPATWATWNTDLLGMMNFGGGTFRSVVS